MRVFKFKGKIGFCELFQYIESNFSDEAIILDSSLNSDELGEYSFIPMFKTESLISSLKSNEVYLNGNKTNYINVFQGMDEVLKFKRDELNINKLKEIELFEGSGEIINFEVYRIPFKLGFAGFCDYESGLKLNDISFKIRDNLPEINSIFNFYEVNLALNIRSGELFLFSSEKKSAVNFSIDLISKLLFHIEGFKKNNRKNNLSINMESKEEKNEYIKKIREIKRLIYEGNVYQINYTRRVEGKTDINHSDFSLYKALREINRAPFSGFYKNRDFCILSSSPERLFEVRNNIIATHPIKGTIGRGKNNDEDKRNKDTLFNSLKDRAELLMIVDLARNDLGKISKTGTVEVPRLFSLETYARVHHLVSTIRGELKDNISIEDIFKSIFPGGSITGTPKVSAMEIIEDIEDFNRGPYTGTMGYIDIFGNMDFNILIRTIIRNGEDISYNVGGGITWKSEEESEYIETQDKGSALIDAIRGIK